MFSKTRNIDSAFRHIKTFSIILIVANVITVGLYVYFCEQRVKRAEDKVLILLNGKVVSAITSDRTDNLLIELKDHVKTFHQLFFTLAPDEKVITGNITKALYLADATAKREYDNLKEQNYYSNVISGNVSQTVLVDSIKVNTDTYPYSFRFFGRQEITRATTIATRSLVTEGLLRSVSRSDNNPHGFLLEGWHTLENQDISIKNR
ncbi:conjugative transposon protein TraK [Pedobacter nutrimenti]|uniref:conjugative transposon protein TraK n=1 Tax=Pedobacter nutrimenti TaxID=1241337 RepID=UPI0029309355|nr:conjugative transposon protein TraK [Pedobacter nutrimenti]